jgi:uncharacterized alkaline shock family protein YloU
MALQITDINVLKNSEVEISKAKAEYDDILKNLENAVKSTENSWNDKDGVEFRTKVLNLINNDLKEMSMEMEFEINYLKKIAMVLENAQQEIKKRINN